MPTFATLALAYRKGFTLSRVQDPDRYRLVDNYSGLPELNIARGSLFFSLAEAVAFLEPLRDRVAPKNP